MLCCFDLCSRNWQLQHLYIYIYIYIYVCVCVCIYVCMYVCMNLSLFQVTCATLVLYRLSLIRPFR